MQQQQQQQQQQHEEHEEENWRQFAGSELGTLWSGIYGTKKDACRRINYPVLSTKTKKSGVFDPSKVRFLPVNSKVTEGATDPRKTSRRAVTVACPKPSKEGGGGGKENQGHLLLLGVPRRRNEETIRAELEEIKLKAEHYRPAYVRPIGTEEEKERFSQICTHKGGKGLPKAAGMMPVGEAPFELANRKAQAERNEALYVKRHGARPHQSCSSSSSSSSSAVNTMSVNEQLAEQIAQEIDERMTYLDDMRTMGKLSKKDEVKLKIEISSRVQELGRLKSS